MTANNYVHDEVLHCKHFWLIDVNRALIDITRKRAFSDAALDET